MRTNDEKEVKMFDNKEIKGAMTIRLDEEYPEYRLPRGLVSKPQVISYSPGSRITVILSESPGAMFSRSSTTITPLRISYSSLRPLLFLMLNTTCPLGT